MHAIEIMGERYIKATDAASLTGYATDYIGQLSRSGKIGAERVGRVWYVKESDLIGHRKGAARSNKRKTQEALRTQVEESQGAIHHVFYQPDPGHQPEYRKRLLSAEIKYEDDMHPLAPSPKKSHVRTIESHKIEIKANELAPIELPVERMLEVASLEEDAEEEVPEAPKPRPEPKMKGRLTPVEVAPESEESDDTEEAQKADPETITVPPLHPRKKALVPYGRPSYALMLPVARVLMSLLIVLAFGLSLSGVFLEQVMVYERGKSMVSRPYYEMSYGVRAVSAIKEAISW